MERLPLETQTILAELSARLAAFEGGRAFAALKGSFARKPVKGADYWYFRSSEAGAGQREYFVGPDDAATRALMDAYGAERGGVAREAEDLARLADMARRGGAMALDVPSARVLRGLAASGLFRLGGVLVGTQAFVLMGNVLGVRWSSALRTQDIDGAAPLRVAVAVPPLHADLPGTLEALAMGFLPVPGLDPRDPTTSFKVRGQALRVDLLTPAPGARASKPISIPRLAAAAQPLEGLAYLLEEAVDVALIPGAPALLKIPDPARFALHKLALAGQRSVGEQVKAGKDLEQARQVVEALMEDRPGDLVRAGKAMRKAMPSWAGRAIRAIRKMQSGQTRMFDPLLMVLAG